jgi:hypothetical protein
MAQRADSPVFRGTVRDVRRVPGGQVAIMDVDRVWKGRGPRQVTLHNQTGSVDSTGRESFTSVAHTLNAGSRYVIFTYEQDSATRGLFGTKDAATYGAQGCGIFLADHPKVSILGKGREPEHSTSAR